MESTWLRTMRQLPTQANGTVASETIMNFTKIGALSPRNVLSCSQLDDIGNARPERRRDGEHEDERRQACHHFAHAHDGGIDPASAVSGEQPQPEAEEQAPGDDDDKREEDRRSRGVDDPGVEVPAQCVCPEPVVAGWSLAHVLERAVLLIRIGGGDHGCEKPRGVEHEEVGDGHDGHLLPQDVTQELEAPPRRQVGLGQVGGGVGDGHANPSPRRAGRADRGRHRPHRSPRSRPRTGTNRATPARE